MHLLIALTVSSSHVEEHNPISFKRNLKSCHFPIIARFDLHDPVILFPKFQALTENWNPSQTYLIPFFSKVMDTIELNNLTKESVDNLLNEIRQICFTEAKTFFSTSNQLFENKPKYHSYLGKLLGKLNWAIRASKTWHLLKNNPSANDRKKHSWMRVLNNAVKYDLPPFKDIEDSNWIKGVKKFKNQ
eukprot:TRINITY_DN687_c0_g2_i3.p1 TRINITY_DN687_c0_g2~~TRINITY_DN687_c0_g2_i3.p1  ORF type:complete len:188 (+),score=30.89 TRINITY_DN687_c0_g2_i3:343-906(+)